MTTMKQERIDRINELARKAKASALTEEELAERDALRKEYIQSVKESLCAHLDNTWVVDNRGKRRKLSETSALDREKEKPKDNVIEFKRSSHET